MSQISDIAYSHVFTPSEAVDGISLIRATGLALFLWGPPGIAKSALSQQLATRLGIAFVDIRLSQMDPTDLRGLPYPTNIGGQEGVAWSAPLVLPRDLDHFAARDIEAIPTPLRFYNPKGVNGIHYCTDPRITAKSLTKGLTAEIVDQTPDTVTVVLVDENGEHAAGRVHYSIRGEAKAIIALEELNSAPQSVMAASYQLVLDHRLGDYEIPAGCWLMAMGNRENDKGVTFTLPSPLANRFIHAELVANADDWNLWALKQSIHPTVVSFLAAAPEMLFKFDKASASRGFPTPRSWKHVSDILFEQENGDNAVSDKNLTGLISGTIGDAAAIQLMEHRKHEELLPDSRGILAGSVRSMRDDDTPAALAYNVTIRLCYMLAQEVAQIQMQYADAKVRKASPEMTNWYSRADNFIEFITKNFKPEIAIMGAKASLAAHGLPFSPGDMKHFADFAKKYRPYIL